MSDYHQEQQEMEAALRRDAHRIFAYLESHIAPSDMHTMKYLMGIDEVSRKQLWLEMACSCGEDV